MAADEALVTVLIGLAIVVGVVGTLLPVLPGLLLVWGAMFVYGILVGFGWAGWAAMTLATMGVALGFYLNLRIPQRKAAGTGLTLGGQLFAALLAVIGFFVVPVIGAGLGFVLGVFVIRLHRTKNGGEAWQSTKSILGSLLRASAAQALVGVAMGVVWLAWVGANSLSA